MSIIENFLDFADESISEGTQEFTYNDAGEKIPIVGTGFTNEDIDDLTMEMAENGCDLVRA